MTGERKLGYYTQTRIVRGIKVEFTGSVTISMVVTLAVIYTLYKYIQNRLNDIDARLSNLSKEIEGIGEMCFPLLLLNIFDEKESLTLGNNVDLSCLVSDFKKADNIRMSKINNVNSVEKIELEQQEKRDIHKKDFVPSKHLKSIMLSASTAILVRQTIYKQLQIIKGIYFDTLSGKLSISDARKKAKDISKDLPYKELEDVRDFPEMLNRYPNIANEIEKEFDSFYSTYERRYKNGKWKETLEWHREMEKPQ